MNNKPRFDWSNLENDYKKYKSTVKIAEKYGCTPAAVHNRLKQIGVKTYSQKIEIENVVELYKKHKSVLKVAEIAGVTKNTVLERLKEKGAIRTHDNKGILVNVGLGRVGEKIGLKVLSGSEDKTGGNIHYPYDLDWNNKKVNVKVSRPSIRYGCKTPTQWIFGTGKNKNCDLYLCIGLDEKDEVEKIFLIPSKVVPKGNLGFSRRKSKYDEYLLEVEKSELNQIIRDAEKIGRENS